MQRSLPNSSGLSLGLPLEAKTRRPELAVLIHRAASPSPSPYGRTRMIVLPLTRSVIEGGEGVVKGRGVSDDRPQSSVPHPLDDLLQLGATGLDDEVDRSAVGGPRFGRAGVGHQRSSGSIQASGPVPDVPAEADWTRDGTLAE
jgi:hypothetical protein